MTKTIKSQTSDSHYFLTIENGNAVQCTCKDRQYRPGRPGGCKHMSGFNAEVARAEKFLALKNAIRGMEESARCYRELANSY